MVSEPAMTIAHMIGNGLEKFFVSWWLGVRKNVEYHARFTHYPHNGGGKVQVIMDHLTAR